jgi:hypothetical protein
MENRMGARKNDSGHSSPNACSPHAQKGALAQAQYYGGRLRDAPAVLARATALPEGLLAAAGGGGAGLGLDPIVAFVKQLLNIIANRVIYDTPSGL